MLRFNPNANALEIGLPEPQGPAAAHQQAKPPGGAPPQDSQAMHRPPLIQGWPYTQHLATGQQSGPPLRHVTIGQGHQRESIQTGWAQSQQMFVPPSALMNHIMSRQPDHSLREQERLDLHQRPHMGIYNPFVDQLVQLPAPSDIPDREDQQRNLVQMTEQWQTASLPEYKTFYLNPSKRFHRDASGRSALMLAAEADDIEAVRALLSRTILSLQATLSMTVPGFKNLFSADERDRTHGNSPIWRWQPPLTVFSWNEQKSEVSAQEQGLLELNLRARDGRSSLMFAAEKGHAGIVTFLIKAGAFTHLVTHQGDTAFSLAARNGHLNVVRILLNEMPVLAAHAQLTHDSYPEATNEFIRRALSNEEALIAAAQDENPQRLAQLVEGKDPSWLNSALRTVCGYGLTRAAERLISSGAQFNSSTDGGQTAVLIAAEHGHAEIVRLLAERKANLVEPCKNGKRLWSIAVEGGHHGVLSQLFDRQTKLHGRRLADFEQPDAESALKIAVRRGDFTAVHMLCSQMPRGTYSSSHITTAVKLAESLGRREVARLLNRMDHLSNMREAATKSNDQRFDELITSFADEDATLAKSGLNPLLAMLEHSMPNDSINLVRYENYGVKLLRAGFDATAQDSSGQSVLDKAAMVGALQLADLIVRSGSSDKPADLALRDLLLNDNRPQWGSPSQNNRLHSHLSLLDWLVFSEPVEDQAKHLPGLQLHGLWPIDQSKEQRDAVLRKAAEKGCSGVVMSLLPGAAEPAFVRDLMLSAAQNGSWNVMKALLNIGWDEVLDNEILGEALIFAVRHQDHAAVAGIFQWNTQLADDASARRTTAARRVRTLLPADFQASFQLAQEGRDFRMLDRLIKSGSRPVAPEGGWPNDPSQPLNEEVLENNQAWATLDHVWCVKNPNEKVKSILQKQGMWPLDEQDGNQISAAMQAAAQAGCPHIFGHLEQLPSLQAWRQSKDNAATFDAMMQQAFLVVAQANHVNMFEVM